MEATSETESGDDWLAGSMIEFGGEISERVDLPLEGIEFGADDVNVA
ncbi:MAG TPA: hypothetical protein VGX25_22060 [Actinophytocola sp.]|nr:hypothetical protein [Actinophytocola sp.]HEV2782085.1 hypothetical protein [Actinophytocola sp.]